MKKYFLSSAAKLIYAILFILIIQSIGDISIEDDLIWYRSLTKPPFVPPSYVFGVVWPILYLMIAISFWEVWIKRKTQKKIVYIYFFLQIFFNLAWPFCFFYLQNILLGFIDIILLDIFIFLTLIRFAKISIFSTIMLIPYALWVLFATYLNIGYLLLN